MYKYERTEEWQLKYDHDHDRVYNILKKSKYLIKLEDNCLHYGTPKTCCTSEYPWIDCLVVRAHKYEGNIPRNLLRPSDMKYILMVNCECCGERETTYTDLSFDEYLQKLEEIVIGNQT